ncbi:MAG: hypothetical protein ACREPD_04945 [Stenotrophomonas sp.]|uniref:Bbp19 family protein n=1 Tax=Stenotrophomonas sp. TaxID=69392 RepID=UPI003D6CA505
MTDAIKPTPEMYARVFENHAEGALILEDLARRFHRPAVLDGENAALKTYHREGARSVVDFIVTQCNRANGVTADEPDEHE